MTVTKTEPISFITRTRGRVTQCDSYGPGAYGNERVFVQSYQNSVTYGENYKDWKQRLANGEQCTTFMSGTKYHLLSRGFANYSFSQSPKIPGITCQAFHYLVTDDGYSLGEYLDLLYPVSDPTSMVKADASALASFVSKIRSVQTSFQGGVFLGELKETIEMLTHPAKSLRHGLSSYLATLQKRKRQVRGVRNLKKRLTTAKSILADTWLEYSFGWRPLLHDIDDAAKTLANRLASTPRWEPVFAVGKDERSSDYDLQSQMPSVMGQVMNRIHCTVTKEVKYRGQVNVEHPYNKATWHSGIFRPDDFLPTVWELIPYSFLVDYFANIGSIISAASLVQSNLRWAAVTTVDKLTVEITNTTAIPNGSAFFTIWGNAGQNREKRSKTVISRAPFVGSLVPPLQIFLPGHDVQWINMAALLIGNRSLVPFHR